MTSSYVASDNVVGDKGFLLVVPRVLLAFIGRKGKNDKCFTMHWYNPEQRKIVPTSPVDGYCHHTKWPWNMTDLTTVSAQVPSHEKMASFLGMLALITFFFLFPELPRCQRLFLDQREKRCVRFCPSPNP